MTCKYCGSTDLTHVYTPAGSKIGLTIHVCQHCGLVQGVYDVSAYEEINDQLRPKDASVAKISCDSDYSEIRVGKQQMADKPFPVLATHTEPGQIRHVLDLRSARGDFAERALSKLGLDKVYCIEQDGYMTTPYDHDPRYVVHRGKYQSFQAPVKFDLIYSCHTLEHYRDPDRYFDFVAANLADGGLFYLDVPNIDSLAEGDHYDDFFYDKHLFYFSPRQLCCWLESKGMEIVDLKADGSCIDILARKTAAPGQNRPVPAGEAGRMQSLIAAYADNLRRHRDQCPTIVQNLKSWLDGHSRIAVFGCGRLLDAMIVYGGLDLDRFALMIDNFLSKATPTLYDRPVTNQQALGSFRPDAVLVLTRAMPPQLAKTIQDLAPGADVRHFSSFK